MSTDDRPLLRVVRGDAAPEEIAALVAVLAARAAPEPAERPARDTGGWAHPSRLLRRPLTAGPGAWRATTRSR